jgi:hypothetical protein
MQQAGLRCPADDRPFSRHLPGRTDRRAVGCRGCVGAQLGIHDVACLADYAVRPATAWEHAAEIRRIYGYRDFTDPAEGFRLVRWLYTRAWLSLEQPSVLFDLATARLVERQVLLPGVSILARLVARIRERANARLYRKLARMPSAEQRDRLTELLVVPAGARRSALDRLRRGPTQPTAAGLVEGLRRLNDARALGVSDLDLTGIPAGRLGVLARYASSARAQVFQRMPAERASLHCSPSPARCRPPPRNTPSVCCRHRWRRSNGMTCTSRRANGGVTRGHNC